jgi:2-oxoisovalerate dehydrogenase E2 component (dihydrolipoyl transacylase)
MFSVVRAGVKAACRFHSGRRVSSVGLNHRVIASEVQRSVVSGWRGVHTSPAFASPLVAFNLPDVGERIATVVITEWLVKEGDTVSMGDALCEVQSDKSAVTVYSPYDGVVKELVVGEEETAHLEKPLVVFEVEDGATGAEEHELKQSPPPPAESAAAETTPSTQPPVSSGKVLATPAVRHLAAEKGVNLADVVPTGKGGRLVKEDILNYITSNTGEAPYDLVNIMLHLSYVE